MTSHKHRIHIVGVGADGFNGLSHRMQRLVISAPMVFGSARILQTYKAKAHQTVRAWVSPFIDNICRVQDALNTYKTVVVLATGDGNWYGPSRLFIAHFGADMVTLHPHVGAFQLATSYLRWHMQDCHFTTVHGRNIQTLTRHLYQGARVVTLSQDKQSPQHIAQFLVHMGLEQSILHVLNDMGADTQTVQTHTAYDICDTNFTAQSDLNTVAIECVGHTPSVSAGVADDIYAHNGQITKSPIRAISVAQLQPYPNAVLWDMGAGSGSISIEWCRFGGVAHAFERTKKGCDFITQNAQKFGVTDNITLHHTHIKGMPKDTDNIPSPDAIFIGGGISGIDIQACIDILPVGGRLVVNTVTTIGESILLQAYETYGGELQKINITKTARTPRFSRWAPLIPVMQYTYVKGDTK